MSVADDGRLELKGSMRKGVSVPFSSKATAGATTDGRLQLHVESFKALGVPAKGLLKIFGLELDDLVSLKNRRDVVINDNDIVIAPGEALPPPTIRGHLARVAVVGDGLELSFANKGPAPARLGAARSVGAQLRLLRRWRRPVRQAVDEPCRPAAHRPRPP